MKRMKTALIVGAGLTTIGLGGLGVASAATAGNSADHESSLVSKIASKFNLNKSEVQAVFDQDRTEHMAEMKANRTAALKQAVTDGKLTQAQADHITAVWKEIDTLMAGKRPDQLSSTTRDAIKSKMDALKTWAQQQKLDLRSIDGLGGPGHGHRHGFGDRDNDDATSSTN